MDRDHHQEASPRASAAHSGPTRRSLIALAVLSLTSVWLASEQAQAADAAAQAAPGAQQAMKLAAAGPIQLTIGAASVPPPPPDAGISRGPNCTSAAREPQQVQVPVGKSRMISLPEAVRTRTLGNPSVVQAMLVSPQTLYLLGLDVGTTNMIVQGKSGSCSVIDVTVGADPGGLQSTLHALLPQARQVRVASAADSLVLSGNVPDSTVAQMVIDIANAFVVRQTRSPLQAPQQQIGAPAGNPMLAMAGSGMGGLGMLGAPAGGNSAQPLRSPRIINMMTVDSPQQVMLEVKVAEVSKTLIDQLGASANLNGAFGSWSFGLLANFLSGGAGVISGMKSNNLPFNFQVDAQKGDSLVKVLAEPNLMAISGQEASFLAGGKVFIPVPQASSAGGTTITLQEETFGVGLRFTPTVLANGRINLKVAPEVSELSPTGVALSAPNLAGTTILPLITTRRASTTLQVMDGQSFAIGGLIKSNVTGSLKALPGAGELPVLGNLFRSTNFQQDKSELLFVVTPRLVKPLPANYPMPTDSFGAPTPGEVFINGNMEGHPATPTPPAMPPAPAGAPPAPMAPAPAAPSTSTSPASGARDTANAGALVPSSTAGAMAAQTTANATLPGSPAAPAPGPGSDQ
ncbi:type II and III secretion system protein family protein [Cupriavidus basilensis]|uniref:type II and III secretion system protein family protein n=1 Tax=Cupriavidus basilensis TaxID=68895 RepID=UPI0028496B7D|nr:type II and III secretion system protein family protein [Cupriavidus basilensis]MDR3384523.1 type II and III secretion system protein family protein [Cupriavidus basilensis]